MGYSFLRWTFTASYNRITKDGRYLNPREWAYDPFYTFLPRELNEGFGDVNAAVLRVEFKSKNQWLRTSLSYGYCDMPDVKNYALNKYGMPSYQQGNAEVRYSPEGFFKGCNFAFLLVYKNGTGNTYGNDKYVINKVDVLNYNVAVDVAL